MIPRLSRFIDVIRRIEHNVLNSFFGQPPKELALAYVHNPAPLAPRKFSLQDIIGDGFLMAVPKFRRTIEKRLKRKFGSPQYVLKILQPKTNILVCKECGHHYESGRLCGHCYKKIESETKEIQEKIVEKLSNSPIDKEVIVLYEGENVPDQPKEFWKGKRIIEMKKERPHWFSKNLLQKSTQEPSDSKDVKPTDLA
ncbi:large ribosomal subunit protein bL32m [Ostrinia nubilalis]|uniref:39S ribosomal protein L32, mitochondrial n=1 Tax=Ostrinia furnacalis TaxID=93504 RepID=UPI00103F9D71|nr:39S ribosomal protein L32, mitochondrial [Ostrinia furnacalis]